MINQNNDYLNKFSEVLQLCAFAGECFFGVPPLNTKLNQAMQFLSQCGHNAVVKVNLKTIGKEKNSADLLSVFVQQTLATASTRQGSQVQILSHPPFFQPGFFLCHNREESGTTIPRCSFINLINFLADF